VLIDPDCSRLKGSSNQSLVISVHLRYIFSFNSVQKVGMSENLKRKTFALLLATVILTVLIAAALPKLQLEPGTPLPFQPGLPGTLQTDQPSQVSISVGTSLKAVLEFILFLVIVYIGYKLVKGVPWNQILVPALFIAILTMIALTILFFLLKVQINFEPFAPDILPPAVSINVPPLGPLPPGLLWLVWCGLALLVILLGIWLVRWRSSPLLEGAALESEAQQALQALQSGSNIEDVILRCYVQMSRVLQKEQKLELKQTMTAREFERLLEARGFPADPVHQLTGLFENVRYGHRRPGPAEEQQAFDCLNAIVQYSCLSRNALTLPSPTGRGASQVDKQP